MKRIFSVSLLCMLVSAVLYSQSGSINNTLGAGGSFKVKSAASDSLLVVKENGSIGIGTSNPASTLDVAGQLTTNQIKVDGIPSFLVTHITETGLNNQPSALATWDEATGDGVHDNSASFNPSTGQFVAPRNGFYFLSAYIEVGGAGTSGVSLAIKTNYDFTGLTSYSPSPGSAAFLSVSGIVKLTAGRVVTVVIFKPGSAGSCSAGAGYFSGYLVSDF